MKKIFILLFSAFLFLTVQLGTFARDYAPKYSDSINYYGLGVYFTPAKITVYTEPDEKSKILGDITWSEDGISVFGQPEKASNVFLTFKPDDNTAILSVDDETDNWCSIIYNQTTGKSGWIKKSPDGKFYTWMSLLNTVGRKNGMYFWSNLDTQYKQLYTSPDTTSNLIKGFYYPDNIEVKIVRGNWVLVKLIDFDKTPYVGWLRWRSEDGKLYVFPKML